MPIIILSNSLINKIAAGEVIERPASVVKELLENAFDSGADEIKIELEDYGLKKIKISDNGCGMDRSDLLLSCKRHATSKIKDENDLFNIKSLGFRGEALASIAEISNIKIKTRTKDSTAGNFVEIEGGIPLANDKIGCPEGTIVEVSNLFYNVPARKKFLKTNDIELSYIIKVVSRYALIKKEINIRLFHNNQEILNSNKTESLLENIMFIYGTEIANDLLEINFERNNIKLYGFISKPNLTRANKNDQSLYINERFVKNDTVSNAVYEAYKTLLFINRHPIFVLDISIDPREIDVNVHPAKEIAKFRKEEMVYSIIYDAVKNALSNDEIINSIEIDDTSSQQSIKNYNMNIEKQANLFSSNQNYKIEDTQTIQQNDFKINIFEKFNILGQINKTFLLCEVPEGLAIIDQHAAEERVNYELFLKQLKENSIKKQKLLGSKVLELTPMQKIIALTNKPFLNKIGFDFEDFGENSIKVSSIPEVFGKLKTVLFVDIVNELTKIKGEILDKEIEDKIIRFACKASVKAGDEMTIYEMKVLLKKLGECENPFSCPHGRPTIIKISVADLEKKFKRTGW